MTRPPPLNTTRAQVFDQALKRGYFHYATLFGALAVLIGTAVVAIGFRSSISAFWWLGVALTAVAANHLGQALVVRKTEVFAVLLLKGVVAALAGATLIGPGGSQMFSLPVLLATVLLLTGLAHSLLGAALSPLRGSMASFIHGIVMMLVALWALFSSAVRVDVLVIVFGAGLILDGIWQIAGARMNRRYPGAGVLGKSPA